MNWGEAFFRNGWKGRNRWQDQPWTVIDRKPAIRTEQDFYAILKSAEQTEGWVFGLWEDKVLHSPIFGVVASEEIQRRIIAALEAYPARRVLEFEQRERPQYERLGWPPEVIEQMGPRLDAQLRPEQFNAPILTTAQDGCEFVGVSASWDVVLEALTQCQVSIDRAVALRILLTVHGDPGEKFKETPWTQPFHPDEFRGLLVC